MKKYISIFILIALVGLGSCGEDFLTSLPTEKQAAGSPATEGAILSNLGAAYQVLLFDSYANNNYNSIVLMSDLRSDDIYKGVEMQATNVNSIFYLYLLQLLKSCLKDYGTSITRV